MNNNLLTAANKFLSDDEMLVTTEPNTGKQFVKAKEGLIERVTIERKLVVEDGRELLREETPISHSRRTLI